jgi:HSP20 family protein
MSQVVDPLRALRPLREEEFAQLTDVHEPDAAPLAYDVYRAGDELVIEFDTPGVAPSAIEVSVEGQAIVVTLRRELAKGPGVDVIESGRQHGTFRRRLWLGDRWDLQGVRARAENGVLSVRAPLAAATTHRVEVTTHEDRAAPATGDGPWHQPPGFDELAEAAPVHPAA